MQITLNRGELRAAVTGFSKIVSPKTTLPILAGVRLESTAGNVTAAVTDLDQHLRYRFGAAHAQGDAALVVPLANLKDLAKGNTEEVVEFDSDSQGGIVVTNHVGSHAVRHPIQGLDIDDWPQCPPHVATLQAPGFLETYRRLAPFASTDATRQVLNSVFIDTQGQGDKPVTMVSCDGRRLTACNSMALPVAQPTIVPVTKFLSWTGLEGDEQIATRTQGVKKDAKVLAFVLSSGPWVYDVRAVDGQYPNWRQVVPPSDDGASTIAFSDADAAALRKILPGFPGTGTESAMIALRPSASGKLVIAGRGCDDSRETTLELEGGSTFDGKLPAVGVNAFFLLDALQAGFRRFTAVDELSPLRADDTRGGTHVLMPMRLGAEAVKNTLSTPETGNGVAVTPEVAPQGETTTPTAENHKTKGGRKTMIKEANGNGTTDGTALDKVLTAVETAKAKLREAVASLSEVADAVKTAVKEGRAQAADLEKARTTLQKLQAISL
jgi:DNA polymerase-3 subunit beta